MSRSERVKGIFQEVHWKNQPVACRCIIHPSSQHLTILGQKSALWSLLILAPSLAMRCDRITRAFFVNRGSQGES